MKKLLTAVLAAGLCTFAYAKDIVIYHTSDTHGFYYPTQKPGAKDGVLWGGFAAVKSVVDKETLPRLLLDSGDFANGTIEAAESKGLTSVKLMNAVGYDAVTIGNHEADFGDDNLINNLLPGFELAVLAANVTDATSKNYPLHTQPYKIFDVDGVKVAVIGIAKGSGKEKLLKFQKPETALKKILPEVEKHSPDVTVVIAHDSVRDGKIADVPSANSLYSKLFAGRINIVLGGHVHVVVQNEYINGVLFAEPGEHLKRITKVTITLDDTTGKFISAKSQIIPLNIADTGKDPAVKTLAEGFKKQGIDAPIGRAAADLSHKQAIENCFDFPLDNLIADWMQDYASEYGSQLFINNTYGTRDSVYKGDITMRDVINIHPFDNKIFLVKVNGTFLKNLLREGIKENRSLWQVSSNVKITYRYQNGKAKDMTVTVDGRPVENHKEYVIATNSYIATGGSEGWQFKSLPEGAKEQAGEKNMRQVITEGIEKNSPLRAPEVCRIEKVK